jgi:hypothetical protein
MKTLRLNDKGNEVKQLQEALNSKGANLTVDGIFGRLTQNAVVDFQIENNLTIDGIVGPKTWGALGVVRENRTTENIPIPKMLETDKTVVKYSLAKDGEIYITKYFQVKEFASKCGSDVIIIDVAFAQNLDKILDHFDKDMGKHSISITSGYRTDAHNKVTRERQGLQQNNSNHRYNETIAKNSNNNQCNGSAIDFTVIGIPITEVCRYCESIGIKGIIQYPTFTHIDNRNIKYFSRNSGNTATNTFR